MSRILKIVFYNIIRERAFKQTFKKWYKKCWIKFLYYKRKNYLCPTFWKNNTFLWNGRSSLQGVKELTSMDSEHVWPPKMVEECWQAEELREGISWLFLTRWRQSKLFFIKSNHRLLRSGSTIAYFILMWKELLPFLKVISSKAGLLYQASSYLEKASFLILLNASMFFLLWLLMVSLLKRVFPYLKKSLKKQSIAIKLKDNSEKLSGWTNILFWKKMATCYNLFLFSLVKIFWKVNK